MALPKYTLVTRTQVANEALKNGTVKPKTFEPEFIEVDPLIAAFRRMVRKHEFDITEMAITTYMAAKAYEAGVLQRTVIVEFESLEKAIACHDSPAYQAALEALGDGVTRDLRVVEGV